MWGAPGKPVRGHGAAGVDDGRLMGGPTGGRSRQGCHAARDAGFAARWRAVPRRFGWKHSAPFWPQPTSATAPATRALAVTRIWNTQHGEIVMTDLEFMDRAEAVLKAIESCCDHINEQTDADIDNQRVGGMVTLVFADGSQIVVNLQKPLHEIWLASRKQAGITSASTAGAMAGYQGPGRVLCALSQRGQRAGRPALVFRSA
jgi:CyaY protein